MKRLAIMAHTEIVFTRAKVGTGNARLATANPQKLWITL